MNSSEHRVITVGQPYQIVEMKDGTFTDMLDMANNVSNQALNMANATLNAITEPATASPQQGSNEKKDDFDVRLEVIDSKNINDDDDDDDKGLKTVTSTQSLSLLRESIIDKDVIHTRVIKQTKLANPTHMGIAKALKYFVALIGILAPFAIMPFELQARDIRNGGPDSSSTSDNTLGMALGLALLAIVVLGTVVGYRAGKKKSSKLNGELRILTEKISEYQNNIREELARIFHILIDKSPEDLESLLIKANSTRADAASGKGNVQGSIKGIQECIAKIKRIQTDKSVEELRDFFENVSDHEIQVLLKELTFDVVRESAHIGTHSEKMRGCYEKMKQHCSHGCEGGSNVYATGLTGMAAVDAIGYNIGSTAFTSLSFGLAGLGAVTGIGVGVAEKRYEGQYETQVQNLSFRANLILENLASLRDIYAAIVDIEQEQLKAENTLLKTQLDLAQDFKEEAKQSLGSPLPDEVAACRHLFGAKTEFAKHMLTFIKTPRVGTGTTTLRKEKTEEHEEERIILFAGRAGRRQSV